MFGISYYYLLYFTNDRYKFGAVAATTTTTTTTTGSSLTLTHSLSLSHSHSPLSLSHTLSGDRCGDDESPGPCLHRSQYSLNARRVRTQQIQHRIASYHLRSEKVGRFFYYYYCCFFIDSDRQYHIICSGKPCHIFALSARGVFRSRDTVSSRLPFGGRDSRTRNGRTAAYIVARSPIINNNNVRNPVQVAYYQLFIINIICAGDGGPL